MTPLELLEESVAAILGELGFEGQTRAGRVTAVQVDGQVLLLTCFEDGGQAFVRVAALVLTDVQPSLELLHQLLQIGHTLLLGSLQLFEDGTIACTATFFGHTLDDVTLARALRTLAWVAQHHGPRLQAIGGGEIWRDGDAVDGL